MNTQIIPVPFYEDTLVLTGKDNEPMVVMKSIVENMGLDWPTQYTKLNEKFGATIGIIPMVAEDGKKREMVCLPLRKLPAWLYSINPNKVAPELRDKIIRYQNECDDALWNYWTQGTASRPGSLSVTERLRVHRARHNVLDQLEVTTHRIKRQALYEELAELSGLLGYPAPPLGAIGTDEQAEPVCVTEFWEAIAELESKNAPLNHARTPGMLAINLPHLQQLARQCKVDLPELSTVRRHLHLSQEASLVRYAVVNSLLTQKSVKCYVFKVGQKAIWEM